MVSSILLAAVDSTTTVAIRTSLGEFLVASTDHCKSDIGRYTGRYRRQFIGDRIYIIPSPTLKLLQHPSSSSNYTNMVATLKSSASMLRLASRAFALRPTSRLPLAAVRQFHYVPPRQDKPGSHSRTDSEVEIEYPAEHELPSSKPVSAGGQYVKPTLPSFTLDGKVGVVTGGARGLGLVIGQGMVYSGADLALVDMNKEEAEKQAKLIVDAFVKENPNAERIPKVTAHYADVGDADSVEQCIAEIVQKHGKIDNLVTSAGFTENFEAVNYPIDRLRKLWAVNVDGTYLFATSVARHLMERKSPGSMVMIGSMSGSIVNVPQPQAPYNASKAGVRHLAASLAVEWAHAGIRVNCLSPGYMLTALTQKILDENPDLKQKWVSLIPQGKMGLPQDLMGPVAFLLSDASSYVTGADIRVDGGYTVT